MKTNEDFISDAKKVHGDKYDYSKVSYKGSFEKVCIICPEHGEFWQSPHSHLIGRGCPKCRKKGKKRKSTKEYFISRAFEKHGYKYDYSKVEYIDSFTKVCIICPEHGEFWQSPHNHLNCKNGGCPECSKRKTTNKQSCKKDFIEKAKKIHGDKYNYSKVEYVNNRTKVCIICPEHGEFWQTPSAHLSGHGCNECSKPVFDTLSFIEKARQIHGQYYDYSKTEYVKSNKPVCIICPEHGEFWQTPGNHLSGKGCYLCNRLKADKNKISNKEKFICKAKKVHGDKYDYSKVEYKSAKEKVCIICPEHGEFWQTPNKHLSGEGCPKCKTSLLEEEMQKSLIKENIKYIKEYTPIWANGKRYDFFIPDFNAIIECQGEQHYFPVDFSGKMSKEEMEKNFEKQKENDLLKRKIAEERSIKYVYFTKKELKSDNEFINPQELINFIKNV